MVICDEHHELKRITRVAFIKWILEERVSKRKEVWN